MELTKVKSCPMPCNHAYVRRLAPDTFVCLDCGSVIKPKDKIYETAPLSTPPYIYQLTEDYWKARNPWLNIPRELALKYRWYGSIIYGREYLVMPIYDHATSSEPVFYSARCLTECETAPKYSTPLGYRRVIWKSWEFGVPAEQTNDDGKLMSPILVGEGVADAAWLSQIAPSVALLGSHGELDRPFILILDGDERGITAAFQIVQNAKRRGLVESKTVTLPPGRDPTDISILDLKALIYDQTGVLF